MTVITIDGVNYGDVTISYGARSGNLITPIWGNPVSIFDAMVGDSTIYTVPAISSRFTTIPFNTMFGERIALTNDSVHFLTPVSADRTDAVSSATFGGTGHFKMGTTIAAFFWHDAGTRRLGDGVWRYAFVDNEIVAHLFSVALDGALVNNIIRITPNGTICIFDANVNLGSSAYQGVAFFNRAGTRTARESATFPSVRSGFVRTVFGMNNSLARTDTLFEFNVPSGVSVLRKVQISLITAATGTNNNTYRHSTNFSIGGVSYPLNAEDIPVTPGQTIKLEVSKLAGTSAANTQDMVVLAQPPSFWFDEDNTKVLCLYNNPPDVPIVLENPVVSYNQTIGTIMSPAGSLLSFSKPATVSDRIRYPTFNESLAGNSTDISGRTDEVPYSSLSDENNVSIQNSFFAGRVVDTQGTDV